MSGKFILDTNIWVSYILSNQLSKLTSIIVRKRLTVFVNHELISELKNVLLYPKINEHLQVEPEQYTNFILKISTKVETRKTYRLFHDAKDNFLFDLAIQHSAPILVTGDKKLLGFQHQLPIKIISKNEFEQLMQN